MGRAPGPRLAHGLPLVALVLFFGEGLLGGIAHSAVTTDSPDPSDPVEFDLSQARSETPAEVPVPFWPEVVDTVRIATAAPDIRERMAAGTGSTSFIPLGPGVSGDRDIADLLQRVAGLHVHRFGGLGSFSLASVRGSTPGQVQVYLDDMPLANAATGVVNLSLLPLAELDHAEVYRGPQTRPLGGPPAAGVIRLVSSDRLDVPLSFALGGASFGTRSLRGQWGYQRGSVGAYFGGQWRSSDGDYPYLNRNGTRHNPDDDEIVLRANNRFEDLSSLARLRVTPTKNTRVDYTLHSLSRESGIPGPESLPTTSTDYSLRQQRHQLGVKLHGPYPFAGRAAGLPQLSVFGFREKTTDRFRNLLGEVGLGYADQRNVTKNTGVGFRSILPWVTAGQQLEIAVFTNREEWSPVDLLRETTPPSQQRDRRSWSVAHRATWRSWTLSLGYTRDWMRDRTGTAAKTSSDNPGSSDPSGLTRRFEQTTIGMRWEINERFALRGNEGRFFRVPTFPELFGQNGIQEGNASLRPETGPQWDAGFVLHSRDRFLDRPSGQDGAVVSWRLEGSYFESLTKGKIVLLQNSQRTVQAHNFDRAWIHGIEMSGTAEWKIPPGLTITTQLDLTRQKTRNLGRSATYRDKELPTLPKLEGYLRSVVSWKTWRAEYGVAGRGPTFRDRYNSTDLEAPGYAIHEFLLERDIRKDRIRLRGAIRNLADRKVQDIDAYPLPGRSYLIELIVRSD